jgi:hypothetical protein
VCFWCLSPTLSCPLLVFVRVVVVVIVAVLLACVCVCVSVCVSVCLCARARACVCVGGVSLFLCCTHALVSHHHRQGDTSHSDTPLSFAHARCIRAPASISVGTTDYLGFNSEEFFFYILPWIILEAGYSINNYYVVQHLWTILLHAIIGTILNVFIIGSIMWAVASGVGVENFDLVHGLLFGSFIAAVDPVAVSDWCTQYHRRCPLCRHAVPHCPRRARALVVHISLSAIVCTRRCTDTELCWVVVGGGQVLSVMDEFHVHPSVNAIIGGESLLNDGVAVVMYRVVLAVAYSEAYYIDVDDSAYAKIFGVATLQIIIVFSGGAIVGVVLGVLACYVLKKFLDLCTHQKHETAQRRREIRKQLKKQAEEEAMAQDVSARCSTLALCASCWCMLWRCFSFIFWFASFFLFPFFLSVRLHPPSATVAVARTDRARAACCGGWGGCRSL